MTEPATGELPWLTLSEAAEKTGVNRETLRSRARRRLLPSQVGNRGQMLVQVITDPENGRDRGNDREDYRELTGLREVPELREAVTDLAAEVAELRVALARAEADRDAAKAIAAAELAAKEALMEDLKGHHREAIAELKAMIAELRRPWWRRWRGA